MALLAIDHDRPEVDPSAWIADTATVVGRVVLGALTSVWYGAVIRGDNDRIVIGRASNVQDNAVLHVDEGFGLTLGDGVTVGHQAVLHGCTVGDGSLIGMRAVILNGARIGRDCLVGAGAVITGGKEFPDGWLIVGSPAKAVRELTPEQVARLKWSAEHYVAQAARHRKTARRID